jgi:hypothetical protein
MANYGQTHTLNGVVLKVTDITPVKTQKTKKSVVGKTLVQTRVIGLNDQQWELDVTGLVTGTTSANLSTNRAAIEALDSATSYALVDGIHDSNYYLEPGSLEFTDSSEDGNMFYRFRMRLIQV